MSKQLGWEQLNELEGKLYVEQDPSLGYYRFKLWFIKLFWKTVGGWEVNFIGEKQGHEIGFQIVWLNNKKKR